MDTSIKQNIFRHKTLLRDNNTPLTRKGKIIPEEKNDPSWGKSQGALLGGEKGNLSKQRFKEMQLRSCLMEKHLRWN